MDVDLWQFVKMERVIGVMAAHYIVRDGGLISIPVTLGLPLATARITSTPPPGPMMAKSPAGRSTLAREGAADIRLFFQLNPDVEGRPVSVGVAEPGCSHARIHVHDRCGGVCINHNVASAKLSVDLDTRMAFHREYSIHLGSR